MCVLFSKKKKVSTANHLERRRHTLLKTDTFRSSHNLYKKIQRENDQAIDILSPEHFELNLNYPHIQVSFVKQCFPQIDTMGLIPDSFYLYYYYYYRRSNACYHQHLRYYPFVVRYRGSCRRRHRLQ